jgi:hypothetical protein
MNRPYANTRIILELVIIFLKLIIPELLFWNNSGIAKKNDSKIFL